MDQSQSTGLNDTGFASSLDCETQAVLRLVLVPILETAPDWHALSRRLQRKGYGLGFRDGRLVIRSERGDAICTGSSLGVPLRAIARRIGRPCIRADRTGRAGYLH